MTASTAATRTGGAAVRTVGVVHVYRVFGTDVAALRGVDLDVAPGERVALLGPSGSGKSTLLSVLAGLRRPSAGSVLVDGDDVARFSEGRMYRYRAATGLMLQGAASNLLSYATPAENVRFARTGTRAALGAGRQVLELAGLHDERRTVDRLDRAGQQAVALAVAVMNAPRLLLVDEPTSQLDDDERDHLLDALVEATQQAGTTVVMVTHDEAVAARMQRMIRMRDGRIGAEGLRHEQYAVIGSDGSVQLPEELLATWPAGSTVRVQAASADEIRLLRRADESREQ
ncbi:ABC transporter ATP-binding protein [Microlunatus ginsengisoli]|uniref:ABC transporter ATP-binding protein n=1 Tax=Microlunatus ginsengisoli TaxID=363863 RepID=A0ABP6ZNZ7_9ACTN